MLALGSRERFPAPVQVESEFAKTLWISSVDSGHLVLEGASFQIMKMDCYAARGQVQINATDK